MSEDQEVGKSHSSNNSPSPTKKSLFNQQKAKTINKLNKKKLSNRNSKTIDFERKINTDNIPQERNSVNSKNLNDKSSTHSKNKKGKNAPTNAITEAYKRRTIEKKDSDDSMLFVQKKSKTASSKSRQEKSSTKEKDKSQKISNYNDSITQKTNSLLLSKENYLKSQDKSMKVSQNNSSLTQKTNSISTSRNKCQTEKDFQNNLKIQSLSPNSSRKISKNSSFTPRTTKAYYK